MKRAISVMQLVLGPLVSDVVSMHRGRDPGVPERRDSGAAVGRHREGRGGGPAGVAGRGSELDVGR